MPPTMIADTPVAPVAESSPIDAAWLGACWSMHAPKAMRPPSRTAQTNGTERTTAPTDLGEPAGVVAAPGPGAAEPGASPTSCGASAPYGRSPSCSGFSRISSSVAGTASSQPAPPMIARVSRQPMASISAPPSGFTRAATALANAAAMPRARPLRVRNQLLITSGIGMYSSTP